MNAREAILAALSGNAEPRDAIDARAAELIAGIERPPPHGTLTEAFATALARPSVGATMEHVADSAAVPDAVARYLIEHALPSVIHLVSPALDHDWSPIAVTDDLPVDGGVVVGLAISGVAETGTLVIDTGPGLPMLPHFLALHHIVVVHAVDLVAHLEDIPEPTAIPRSRFWITGVSGTTDIEGQYVRGAHGPRFLHVVLIG